MSYVAANGFPTAYIAIHRHLENINLRPARALEACFSLLVPLCCTPASDHSLVALYRGIRDYARVAAAA
ncbi:MULTISPECIES: hypothetical protein [unclassified Rhizobium]|uniref:hypothetical protein n=1 Tax=Rhizobium TaxID=379 RepID=UPI001E52F4BB|nr:MULTISPECIES: hypothetical protein [unclassified Rhizobium]